MQRYGMAAIPKILENDAWPGLDPTKKKSQIRIFFWKNLKISEASSYDQINMTEFWLEHDQKFLQRRRNRQSKNKKNQ